MKYYKSAITLPAILLLVFLNIHGQGPLKAPIRLAIVGLTRD